MNYKYGNVPYSLSSHTNKIPDFFKKYGTLLAFLQELQDFEQDSLWGSSFSTKVRSFVRYVQYGSYVYYSISLGIDQNKSYGIHSLTVKYFTNVRTYLIL